MVFRYEKNDFYYDLPPELIAQTPIPERDHSRILCMNKISGALSHHYFYELPNFLHVGDCLVINDSRVLPARLRLYPLLSVLFRHNKPSARIYLIQGALLIKEALPVFILPVIACV